MFLLASAFGIRGCCQQRWSLTPRGACGWPGARAAGTTPGRWCSLCSSGRAEQVIYVCLFLLSSFSSPCPPPPHSIPPPFFLCGRYPPRRRKAQSNVCDHRTPRLHLSAELVVSFFGWTHSVLPPSPPSLSLQTPAPDSLSFRKSDHRVFLLGFAGEVEYSLVAPGKEGPCSEAALAALSGPGGGAPGAGAEGAAGGFSQVLLDPQQNRGPPLTCTLLLVHCCSQLSVAVPMAPSLLPTRPAAAASHSLHSRRLPSPGLSLLPEMSYSHRT